MLMQALATLEELRVTFLAVSRHLQQCQEAIRAQIELGPGVDYRCLEQQHFSPPQVCPPLSDTTLGSCPSHKLNQSWLTLT